MQQALNDYSLKAYIFGRDRLERILHGLTADERAQTTAEYIAVIVLVAAILGFLASQEGVRNVVRDAFVDAFDRIRNIVGDGDRAGS